MLRILSCAGNNQAECDSGDAPLIQQTTPGHADGSNAGTYANGRRSKVRSKSICVRRRDDSAQEQIFRSSKAGAPCSPGSNCSPLLGCECAEQQLQVLLQRESINCCIRNWRGPAKDRVLTTRAKLLSWLRQATIYHDYTLSTLEHAVNFLDRYLAHMSGQEASQRELELAAVAAFLLACKMEEVYIPCLASELQAVSSWPRFLPVMIERMELRMMQALDWRMACITPADLVEPILMACIAWQQDGKGWPASLHTESCINVDLISWPLSSVSIVLQRSFGILAASFADPELLNFKAAEVAACSIALAVHGLCSDADACLLQSWLLLRFPEMVACLPAVLRYTSLAKLPPNGNSSTHPGSALSEAATIMISPSQTPLAKRTRRARSPSSVLGADGILASPSQESCPTS